MYQNESRDRVAFTRATSFDIYVLAALGNKVGQP
jgi:hypothetical protein